MKKYLTIVSIGFIIGFVGTMMSDHHTTKTIQVYDHPTTKEAFCSNQAKWHPDCNVE